MGQTVKQAGWVVVVLLAVSWPVEGQVWRDKYVQAQGNYDRENYDQALALGTEALNSYLAEGAPNADNHAAMLRLLSLTCYARQEFANGLEFARKEIILRETKKDTVYAVALQNRALFEEQLGRIQEAIQSLTSAREIFAGVYPGTHSNVLSCDIGLGTNFYLLSDFEQARKWLNPALEAAEKNGEFTEEILEGYYYAGMVELESGQPREALRRFTKAEELLAAGSLTSSMTYPLAIYGKGLVLQSMRQYDDAASTFLLARSACEKIQGKQGDEYLAIVSALVVNAHYQNQPDKAKAWVGELQGSAAGKAVYATAEASLGVYYHGKMDYANAETFYRAAVDGLNKDNPAERIRYAEANLNLATLLSDQGNPTEAARRIQESRDIVEKERGKQSAFYLVVLNRMGIVELQADHLQAAADAFGQSNKLLPTLSGVSAAERSILLNGQGELALKLGSYRKADSLYNKVIAMYEGQAKSPDRYYGVALNGLAASMQLQGRFSEAQKHIREAVKVTRRLYGVSSLAYANALENEGLLRIRVGDLTAAKVNLDSAAAINEKLAGKESMIYAYSLMSLGRYGQLTGDYTKAEPYLKEARKIVRKVKGNQSPEYASVQNSLALLYQTLGNYRDAEVALKEAREILEKTRGAEYATVIQNLAALYQLEGAYDKAEPLQREALEIDRKTLGESHPQYTITLQNLATLYQKLGRRDEAGAGAGCARPTVGNPPSVVHHHVKQPGGAVSGHG
jgi:tetratricopeptide (TPR) repeat protein